MSTEIKIENKVQGREEKREDKFQYTFLLICFLFVFGALISALQGLIIIPILFVALLFSGFPVFNFIAKKRLYIGNTCLVIREVTTDLNNKKYAVYEEKYDGKFLRFCKLKTKTSQDYDISFYNTPEEANEFRLKILKDEEDIKKMNEHIVKVHP